MLAQCPISLPSENGRKPVFSRGGTKMENGLKWVKN